PEHPFPLEQPRQRGHHRSQFRMHKAPKGQTVVRTTRLAGFEREKHEHVPSFSCARPLLQQVPRTRPAMGGVSGLNSLWSPPKAPAVPLPDDKSSDVGKGCRGTLIGLQGEGQLLAATANDV